MTDGRAELSFLSLSISDPPTAKLVEFFRCKGLAALKDEDQREQWYGDWLAYQAEHRIYASVLSPREYSTLGNEFDLLRYARFLEVFAYFSSAHGYSLQVSFLGLFSILMGTNEALKREAVQMLERGEVLAFGVSEKAHGADLLSSEFKVSQIAAEKFIAKGSKYYIGNSNVAVMISILAKREDAGGTARRMPFTLFALRPREAKSFRDVRKIRTLGVRASYVGEFEVRDHEFPQTDVIAEGRDAWDAVLGTVTLGKFFLGFGSIGMCEHSMREAIEHLSSRILYGKPAIEMPHLRSLMSQAFARLMAMKLYAYRALDYVRAASENDRRYILFCAIQKAKVSTDGVNVMSLLSESIGAKGFESDTYFEMALRDIQLIPGLEGSTHINLLLASQFIPNIFNGSDVSPPEFGVAGENPYLMHARTGGTNRIKFGRFSDAFTTFEIPNVRTFLDQADAFQQLNKDGDAITLGGFIAVFAYGQLIAEHAAELRLPPQVVSVIFDLLVRDASELALASPAFADLIRAPRTAPGEWDFVAETMRNFDWGLP